MASLAKRPDGRWRARYRDGAGREHSRHFARRIDGQQWLDEVTASVVTGAYVDPRAGRVTVEAYALGQWLPSLHLRAQSRVAYEGTVRRHVLPTLGAMRVADVQPSHARAVAGRVRADLAPSTAARVIGQCRALFAAAVEDRIIAASPFAAVRPGRAVTSVGSPPSVASVQAVATHSAPATRALVLVAAQTGMRSGELRGLTVDRVDFLRRSITVDRQALTGRGLPWTFGTTKTDRARTIVVPPSVMDLLAEHLAASPASTPDGLVWHTGNRPLSDSTVSYRLRSAARRAGVPAFRFHDLRHHTASQLIGAGQPITVVSAYLGHVSVRVTLTTYAHLLEGSEASAADALAGLWAGDLPDLLRTPGGLS